MSPEGGSGAWTGVLSCQQIKPKESVSMELIRGWLQDMIEGMPLLSVEAEEEEKLDVVAQMVALVIGSSANGKQPDALDMLSSRRTYMALISPFLVYIKTNGK
eukprot:9258194-Ditylum_brightwellii.AAC.1